jgi:stage IV sporulation protein FB
MPTVIDIPPARRGLLNFVLFNTPVQVQPWFWLTTLILGYSQDFRATVIWVVVVFVSILVHEFGHVLAFKMYGVPGAVLLYSWGGLTIPRREVKGTIGRIVVALGGPVAGFCFAALTILAVRNWGIEIVPRFHGLLPSIRPVFSNGFFGSPYWMVALDDLLFVNIFWGLVNLLPVAPLDGSHISRAIFQALSPLGWRKPWLLVSAFLALAIAAFGFYSRSLYLGIMFLLLGVSSLQMLDSGQRRA